MIADVLRMAPFLEIQRTRRLPFPGNLLVNVGERVNPEDVLAEASILSDVLTLDIARGLGVSDAEAATCLVRELGAVLTEGDIIAQCEGSIPRLVRAPVSGKLIESYQGKAVIATGETSIRIQAGMIGTVEALIPEIGVTLRTTGRLIQGVWGNGRIGSGEIKVREVSLEESSDGNTPDLAGETSILYVDRCLSASDWDDLVAMAPAGLVLGALAPGLIPSAFDLPFPVVVLHGFGNLLPDPAVKNFFQSSSGLRASLNAWMTDIYTGCRPEVIIPQDLGEPALEMGFKAMLGVGARVRVLSGAAMGVAGDVVELSATEKQFESGIAFYSASVRLPNGEMVTVPQQNLLLIG